MRKISFQPDFDFIIFGIASPTSDYKLSWAINQSLDFSFSKADNLEIEIPNSGVTQSFTVYSFTDDATSCFFRLVANRCENGFLLSDNKNIDYIFQIHGSISDEFQQNILRKLKKIEGVITAFPLNISALKSKNRLLIE